MEHPKEALNAALKEAMKNKDTQRRDVIRMTLSAIKQVEVDTQQETSAEDAMGILQKEAKKRRDTIDELTKAGREDQAAVEEVELEIVESFLPRQLSRDEIESLVRDAIEQTGASGTGEMGKVMGVLMPKVKGRADGKLVNQVVRELLS